MVSRSQHHRLLEGFLRRLARRPEAQAYVLRGGMRLRQRWTDRPVKDLDLVCRYAVTASELKADLGAIMAVRGIEDGIRFDRERMGLAPVRQGTVLRGYRAVVGAWVDGRGADLPIDVTVGLPLGPEPTWTPLTSEPDRALWMCRLETQVGRKLQVIAHRGPQRWRAKDVADLHALVTGGDLSPLAIGAALEAAFVDDPDGWWAAQQWVASPSWLQAGRGWSGFRRRCGPLPEVCATIAHGLSSHVGRRP